jgi:hypothetical protein
VALDGISLLLVRPDDLVVVLARLTGFDLAGEVVTAGPAGGTLVLTLPPQSTGETVYDDASRMSSARSAGSSRLTFTVPAGTSAHFTATGILSLAAAGAPVPTTDAALEGPVSVELPYGIRFGLRGAQGDAIFGTLPPEPLVGSSGAAGLWHLRLEAASGLALVPLQVLEDADPDGGVRVQPVLNQNLRNRIFTEGSAQPDPQQPPLHPRAPAVDLSPLGGTMSAKGTWPSFAWEHETVLGRDMRVRVEAHGFLYPWGHRATLIQLVTREVVEEGSTATAGLRSVGVLVVAEPVRRPSAQGALSRALPFDQVEVLQTITEVGPISLDGNVAVSEKWASKRAPSDRQLELDATIASRDAQQVSVDGLFAQLRVDIQAAGVADLEALDVEAVDVNNRLAELAAQKAAFDEWAAHQPVDPVNHKPVFVFEDESVSAFEGEGGRVVDDDGPSWTVGDQAALEELQRQANDFARRRQAIADATAASLAGLVSIDSLASMGSPFAEALAELRRLQALVVTQAELFAKTDREAEHVNVVAEWPTTPDGKRLSLPLRCDALQTHTPALFVHDLHADDSPEFFEFAPLADTSIQTRVGAAWSANDARRLPVPGTQVDLVRSGPAVQPADVLPVHELVIRGAQDAVGSFRAVVEEAKVALKAVGELVPGVDALTRVVYDEKFIAEGIADKVALRLPDPIGVNFSQVADQAGGLLAPVFKADVLSRLDGVVDKRTITDLAGSVPDFAAAFAETKILGFSLASLLDTSFVPKPLTIKETPDGGVKMTWTDLKLKSHDPFRVHAGTKLVMSVERSPSKTETTCRLEDFSLVLPPGGTELVRLDFKALTFTQRPGRPPDLEMEGLEVKLGGDLDLLKELQKHVDLGDAAPKLTSTPKGISAAYNLAVPEVTAGIFVMRNISISIGVEVPFDGRPIVTTLAFARRDSPFTLTVTPFGGSGYLVFEIDEGGIRKLEASLDFGGILAINVGIASAEVHAFGGARFALVGSDVKVTGFLRIGGSVDVLGLVSVSVELRVELTYEAEVLSGRATAVIQVDVTFWSGSITLDSGERRFVGGGSPTRDLPQGADLISQLPTLADWEQYRDKFGAA